jgi:Queuosine salvage protein
VLEVLATAKEVSEQSIYVHIDRGALKTFSEFFLSREATPFAWEPQFHFDGASESMVFYLLVLDTVNFCFWPGEDKPRWEIPYRSGWLSGYYALAVALKTALESAIPLADAEYLASLTTEQFQGILGGRGELQLMPERLENLRALGELLLREYKGRASHLVQAAGGSAVSLARILAEKLNSFRDIADYQGKKVYFYKRAQLFAADLHGAFGGEEWGSFRDMGELTSFADYKLPQVLRHAGVLTYEPDLASKVDQMIYLDPGSPDEVEIRANTIWAVELIREELNQRGKDFRAFEIDWLLWTLGQRDEVRAKPYHRTVTIFY